MSMNPSSAKFLSSTNENPPSQQQQLLNKPPANMQQLMNQQQPSANLMQLMNTNPPNMQQLINPSLASLKQMLNPNPANKQQQLTSPAPTALQHLTNPSPTNMNQLTNPAPAPAHTQQLVGPNSSLTQQLVNPNPSAKQQLIGPTGSLRPIRGDRLLFTSADENALTNQIKVTHSPDALAFDVKPLLQIVEDIFTRAAPVIDTLALPAAANQGHPEALDDKIDRSSFNPVHESLSFVIGRVASEITYKCSGGGDSHATTMAILNMLSSYTWDAKAVIALAAFALNYGDFWLVAQNYTTNQLAKSLAILKQLPDIFEHSSTLKQRMDAIRNLITAMLAITKCIIEFQELPPEYITVDVPGFSTAMSHLPVAVYWTIKSILACASGITSLVGHRHEHMVSPTESWELSTLAHKLANMHSHLADQLDRCYSYIDEKKLMQTYQSLLHIFAIDHIDNTRVLKALLCSKDDFHPLVEGTTKKRVNIDVLRGKNVLLLISDLDNAQEEIAMLEQIYNDSRSQSTKLESQYEIVWLPILDPALPFDYNTHKKFDSLQSTMTWYSIHHPTLIDKAVIKFIKQEWKFSKKPILVVLDPRGKIACPNALHMMWIWGISAFPFTGEEDLWKRESWGLEFLVDNIDPNILNWMQEGKYICLYGGEDLDWIRNFTNTARAVSTTEGITLEMVYVGKSNPKERVRQNVSKILAENLSHCLPDLSSIWYFWVRIESMWRSKHQLGRTSENDPVMKEIMTLLSFDSSQGGWAIFTSRRDKIIKAQGNPFLKCFKDYTAWKDNIPQNGFLPSLNEYLKGLQTEHHCSRLVLPAIFGMTPEKIFCPECSRPMEWFIMYSCCDE